MSAPAVWACWRAGGAASVPGVKLTLLALAEGAGLDGVTAVPVRTIVHYSGQSESTVRKHIAQLRTDETLLYVGPTPEGISRYWINLPGVTVEDAPISQAVEWQGRLPGGSYDVFVEPADPPPIDTGGAKITGGEVGVKGPGTTKNMATPTEAAPDAHAHDARAHTRAREAAAPDPKPANAQPIVAAWIDARRAAGKGDPLPALSKLLGKEARTLLRGGASPEHVTEAARLLAFTNYGPHTLVSFTDQVANGRPPNVAGHQGTLAAAWEHDPFVPGRADEHA